ncbi:hypothetical protein J437_LFUL012548 [Ladona fulva]|uniref:DDE Tnp4 domain-containing protein n=1 Tax=Ladona fulva TaxID=123851 RepID=A0A8K0P4T4_LADFU|nr:hypothetical protein J437_LFUL012548 [Ladona fulva]
MAWAWLVHFDQLTVCLTEGLHVTACLIFLLLVVMADPSPEDFWKVALDFTLKWNFNNCISALDGKHIFIKTPSKSGSGF